MMNMMNAMSTTAAATEDRYWQACLDRDAAFDGRVILAVRTTGIYCRPSCPARKPRRENVAFFALPALARRAGYRPCKRCRPDDQALADPRLALVRAVCRHIEDHADDADEALTLLALGERFDLSPAHLQRTFKEYVGISPLDYREACGMRQRKGALRAGTPIGEAIYAAGFGSSSRVYERAAPQLGMTPRRYQRRGAGVEIRYTVAPCALGQLLVATTAAGVCAVKLGDSAEELERILAAEFGAAAIARDDEAHGEWVGAILDFVAGREPHLDLPLDVRATAFQQQVWAALQRIPYGATRTYADIAREIGQPGAVRAVANACGANPTALVVPCHRVVRSDGGLGGYHWGVERKRALLAREAQGAQAAAEAAEARRPDEAARRVPA